MTKSTSDKINSLFQSLKAGLRLTGSKQGEEWIFSERFEKNCWLTENWIIYTKSGTSINHKLHSGSVSHSLTQTSKQIGVLRVPKLATKSPPLYKGCLNRLKISVSHSESKCSVVQLCYSLQFTIQSTALLQFNNFSFYKLMKFESFFASGGGSGAGWKWRSKVQVALHWVDLGQKSETKIIQSNHS